MKRWTMIAAALLAVLPASALPATQADRLVFAVIVTRHGVRSVSKTPPQYTWADWQPVGPSYLTARGYRLMTYLGQYYRVYFAANGIPVSCTSPNVYLYADKDQRTLASGRALIEGMCGNPNAIPLHHAADLSTANDDALFDATQWVVSQHRIDAKASRDAVLATLPKPVAEVVPRHAPEFSGLQRIMDGRCAGSCTPAASGESVVTDKEGLSELSGPVKTASTYAEDLFLEYAQCRPDATNDLAGALGLHVLAYDINSRNRYNSMVRGGTLFAHIVGMLETKAARPHPEVRFPDIKHDNVVIFSGHDTELGALGGILDAHWHPGGGIVADDMPPGSALVFGLYKTAANDYRVRIRFAFESMEQFRHYRLIDDGVASVPVTMSGCDMTDCSIPLARLSERAEAIAREGLVRSEWTEESSDPVALDPLYNPKWTQCSN